MKNLLIATVCFATFFVFADTITRQTMQRREHFKRFEQYEWKPGRAMSIGPMPPEWTFKHRAILGVFTLLTGCTALYYTKKYFQQP